MENREQILAELKEISPFIAGMPAVNPYTVPKEYFNTLAETLMERISADRALQGGSANIYEVPQGYFEGLAATILSRVHAPQSRMRETGIELEELAPLLNTISRQEIYSIPSGYFDRTDFLTAAKAEKKQARVVNITFAKKWTQYAAAAVMTGILVTGAFLFTDTKKMNYDTYEKLDVSAELNKVSASELVTYLDNPEHAVASNTDPVLSAASAALTEVKNTIRLLSDEDLAQYLKENGDPADVNVPVKYN